jgi:hypothetical protein
MLHHGPVRVPKDAQPGKALVRVELPDGSKYQSLPTDIAVELVRPNAEKQR